MAAEGRAAWSKTTQQPFAVALKLLPMFLVLLTVAVVAIEKKQIKLDYSPESSSSSSPRRRDVSPAFLREISSRDSARCDRIHYSKSPPSRATGQSVNAQNSEKDDDMTSHSTSTPKQDPYLQSMYEEEDNNKKSENTSKPARHDYHPTASATVAASAVKSSPTLMEKTTKMRKGSSASSSPKAEVIAKAKQRGEGDDDDNDDDDDDRELDYHDAAEQSSSLLKSSPILSTATRNYKKNITESIKARKKNEDHYDPLTQLSQEQLTSYLLNRPRGPSLLMPHLPARPENPHLLGGVKNVDDDQAYIEYWAEFRITRESTPKGLNNWFLAWIPNSEYSQTEYFSPTLTRFLSKNHVFEVTAELSVKWYLDMFGSIANFKRMRSLWLRLDDLRESAHRISSDGIDYRACINAGFGQSGWNIDLESLFSLLNEIMFQTWRGYIHPQRAPQIFFSQYRKMVEATMVNS